MMPLTASTQRTSTFGFPRDRRQIEARKGRSAVGLAKVARERDAERLHFGLLFRLASFFAGSPVAERPALPLQPLRMPSTPAVSAAWNTQTSPE